jgi:hypothetical protein
VRICATREVARASNLDYLTGQRQQKQEVGQAGSVTGLEARDNFQKHCLQNTSAEFICGTGVYGDCGEDKSGDECGANTQKQAIQNVE